MSGGRGAYWYRGGEPSLNPPPDYDEEPPENNWYNDVEPPEVNPAEEPDWLQERLDGKERV